MINSNINDILVWLRYQRAQGHRYSDRGKADFTSREGDPYAGSEPRYGLGKHKQYYSH